MRVEAALKALRKAVTVDTVRYSDHALEMIAFAGLDLAYAESELYYAAEQGFVGHNRNHSGRFIAHGRTTVSSFEVVAPGVVIVTIMIQE